MPTVAIPIARLVALELRSGQLETETTQLIRELKAYVAQLDQHLNGNARDPSVLRMRDRAMAIYAKWR